MTENKDCIAFSTLCRKNLLDFKAECGKSLFVHEIGNPLFFFSDYTYNLLVFQGWRKQILDGYDFAVQYKKITDEEIPFCYYLLSSLGIYKNLLFPMKNEFFQFLHIF